MRQVVSSAEDVSGLCLSEPTEIRSPRTPKRELCSAALFEHVVAWPSIAHLFGGAVSVFANATVVAAKHVSARLVDQDPVGDRRFEVKLNEGKDRKSVG